MHGTAKALGVLILLALLTAGTRGASFWRAWQRPPLPPAASIPPRTERGPPPAPSRKASRVSLKTPGSPSRGPAPSATPAPEAALRCARTAVHRPEPVAVDDAGLAGAPALDASERLARYLNEQELKRQPKYRLAGASASLWFARELRAQVEAELRSAEAERAQTVSASRRSDLLAQLRLADEAAEAARTDLAGWRRAPLACDDALVQKAALCAGYLALRVLPEGSPEEAVALFCAADEQRALADLVRIDERVRYEERTARAMARLAYDLDHAYVVTRSVEICLGSPRYLPFVEEKLKEAPSVQWKRGETLLHAFRDASAELQQAGIEPLHCMEPQVQRVLRCVLQAGVIGPPGPRCQAAELRTLVARVQRS